MSKHSSQASFVTIRRSQGVPKGRFTSTMARRLGLRRLITKGQRTGRAVSLILLAGLLTILVEFFVSYAFYVYDAEVRGNRLLSASQIYEASGIDSYSIFWIQPEVVKQRLEALPYIRAATVRCWLPNRVQIIVEEREPLILWRTQRRAFWVDEEGWAMAPLADLPDLVEVEDTEGATADGDGRMSLAIVAAIQHIRQLSPAVNFFHYDPVHGLQFTTPEGVQVYLGEGQDMAYKVQVFDAVRQQIVREGRAVHLIDLRYKDEPYIR
jgi:cell division septal protein FtsQ